MVISARQFRRSRVWIAAAVAMTELTLSVIQWVSWL